MENELLKKYQESFIGKLVSIQMRYSGHFTNYMIADIKSINKAGDVAFQLYDLVDKKFVGHIADQREINDLLSKKSSNTNSFATITIF